jgi:hypothetical protein
LRYIARAGHTSAADFFSDASRWTLVDDVTHVHGLVASTSGLATAAGGSAPAIAARHGRLGGLLQNLSETVGLRVSTSATDGSTGFYLEPLTGVNLASFGPAALYIARDSAAGVDAPWVATELY